MDINNYYQNFNQFKENFINIENYSSSKECKELLLEIGINISGINLNDDTPITALFGFNESINYENDENIEQPFLEDYTDNIYELNNIDTSYFKNRCESIKNLLKKKYNY